MMAGVPGKASARRGGSLLTGLLIIAVLTVAVWWFTFGSLSPCQAMRIQARRIGSDSAGLLGRVAAEALTDLRANDFSPFECAEAAVKMKVRGGEALEDIVLHGRHE